MHDNGQSRDAILSDAEVTRRMALLAQLGDALDGAGVSCVLARTHRLVLRYNEGPLEPSGLTNPQLYIFASDGTDVATTDGELYRLRSSGEFTVADVTAVVAAICRPEHATSPA